MNVGPTPRVMLYGCILTHTKRTYSPTNTYYNINNNYISVTKRMEKSFKGPKQEKLEDIRSEGSFPAWMKKKDIIQHQVKLINQMEGELNMRKTSYKNLKLNKK